MDGYSSMTRNPILSCPDPERLAAFVDGELTGVERQEVVEHLAECSECHEVFVETVRFLEEEPDAATTVGETGRKVLPGPWARSLRMVLVAAALLIVAVGVWSAVGGSAGLLGGSSPNLPPAKALVAELDLHGRIPAQDELLQVPVPPVTRGQGGPSSGSPDLAPVPQDVAFRLGAVIVDLEAALETGRDGTAVELTRGIERLLGAEVGFSEHLVASYQDLRQQIEGDATAEDLAALSGEAAALVEERVGVETFRLGAFAEAGRLAAVAGDLRYFERRGLGRTLRRVTASTTEIPPSLTAKLEGVASSLESDVGPGDLPTLETRFAEIVRRGSAPWGEEAPQG